VLCHAINSHIQTIPCGQSFYGRHTRTWPLPFASCLHYHAKYHAIFCWTKLNQCCLTTRLEPVQCMTVEREVESEGEREVEERASERGRARAHAREREREGARARTRERERERRGGERERARARARERGRERGTDRP
jgi:hypothetical protein